MMAAPFAKLADAVGDHIQAQSDAERFIDRLRTEYPEPDALMRAVLEAQAWSPDRLRGFCRALQKHIEKGAAT